MEDSLLRSIRLLPWCPQELSFDNLAVDDPTGVVLEKVCRKESSCADMNLYFVFEHGKGAAK